MKKVWAIALREYLALVRTKTFIITVVVIPLLSLSSLVIPMLSQQLADKSDREVIVFSDDQAFTNELQAQVAAHPPDKENGEAAKYHLTYDATTDLNHERKLDLSNQLRESKLHAFVVQGEDERFDVYMAEALSASFLEWVRERIQRSVELKRAGEQGIDPAVVAAITKRSVIEVLPPFYLDEQGKLVNEGAKSFQTKVLVPIILIMIMFMAMMFQTTPLVQGVVEEKQRRITEVLLGSLSPFQMMMGKLIGNLGVVMTVLLIYGICLGLVANQFEVLQHLDPALLAWFFVFTVLGILLYGAVFLAIGSVCNDLQETQQLLMPVVVVATLPMIIAVSAANEPLGPFATVFSYFPPATPFLFLVRIGSQSSMAPWEPYLATLILCLSLWVTVFFSARVFRIGVLSQGNAPKPMTMLRWMMKGY